MMRFADYKLVSLSGMEEGGVEDDFFGGNFGLHIGVLEAKEKKVQKIH